MFIGRRIDGSLYGSWSTRQSDDADHPRQEEVADDHPDLLAFYAAQAAALLPSARQVLDEEERQAAKIDAAILALVNATPAQLVTYARNNFPTLTLAEQNKVGVILNILAVAVRDKVRAP